MTVIRNSCIGDVCADADVIQHCDACLITVPATVDYAQYHGVCKLDSSVNICHFWVIKDQVCFRLLNIICIDYQYDLS